MGKIAQMFSLPPQGNADVKLYTKCMRNYLTQNWTPTVEAQIFDLLSSVNTPFGFIIISKRMPPAFANQRIEQNVGVLLRNCIIILLLHGCKVVDSPHKDGMKIVFPEMHPGVPAL